MKMKKRLLSILLTLALVLGLAPGMSLTAYADNPYTGAAKIVCTGTSTITNSGGHTPVNRNATLRYSSLPVECTLKDLTGGFNFANITSSSISQGTNLTIDNTKMTGTISDLGSSSFTLTTTGGNGFNFKFEMTLSVTELATYSVTLHTNDGTISEGKNVTSYVQEMGATLPTSTDITKDGNEFKGWFDNSGLTGNAVTSISTTDTGNKEYWAKWELAHTHSFTYTASGATITAKCTAAGCNLPESSAGAGDHVATLTISANGGTYDGATAYGATTTDTNSIQGDAKIQYQKKTDGSYGTAAQTAPKDAGDYKASITVGGATASVEYTIAQADPTANAPTGLTATYGQTLANVSLEGKNPEGNTPGTWAWADSTQSVGNVVTPAATFKANFTPTSSSYKTVENVDVTVTVSKAANPATVTGTATVIKGGNTVDLANNVTKNGATGDVGYAIDGEAKGCTLNGSVLTSGNTTGTVTVNVTVAADSNYEALAATPITVTINDKGTQTITAADVTVTYGDADKKVNASVTDPAQGGGAISYAVKDGSADYIDVNATTGALTIKKVPADGKAYVVVTAAETAAYAQATKEVTVTINKAAPTVTAPTAKTLTYTGTAQELVNAGSATGGTMQYAIGKDDKTAPTDGWKTSIPTATEAGTYYVWYKVVGDANHNDTQAAKITVTISKATVTAPTIASKTYTGEAQTATVTASTLYSVTTNNGGTNVGSYNVVLTLTDPANYKWTDSTEAAKTLKFNITKATAPTVTVPTLTAVTYDPAKTLADISLPDGWVWVTSSTVPTVGDSGYEAALTVDDANYDYTNVQGYSASTHKMTRTVSLTVNKAAATVTTAPTAKTLSYTGSAQKLVNVGTASGGTMQYALGTSTEATGAYTTSIPEATDAGTYNVWYMVEGDKNHIDSEPACITVSIAPIQSYEVIYKVVGGTWSDGSTEEKTDIVQSGSKPTNVPTDMKALEGYTGGAWDTDPDKTTITEAKTFIYSFTAKNTVSAVVTFKVVNGSWDDGTTADRTVPLTAYEGTALYLKDADIPKVGNKPNDNFAAGTWDTTPNTEAEITADMTYTYTYAATSPTNAGEIDTKVDKKEDTPETTVEGLTEDVVLGVVTDAERTAINNGASAIMSLQITNIDQSVNNSDKQLMEKAAVENRKNAKVGMFLDFSMILQVGNLGSRKVTELNGKSIMVEVTVPENLQAPPGVNRTFFLMSIHNNIAKIHGRSRTNKIPATLTDFSTYAIVYADDLTQPEGFNTSIRIKQKDGKLSISWDKVEGVKKVEVYATYCGNNYPNKAVKTTTGNSVNIKKLNGKKINFKKNMKLYLVAYDSNGNKIGKSICAHFAGKDHKKYTNVKSIELSENSVSLTKGSSKKVKATIKLDDKKKKRIGDDHASKFRFRSTIAGIATVDKNGNITGVSAGTCYVYVYAQNGLAKKVQVTVTE